MTDSLRLTSHPVLEFGADKGTRVTISVNGRRMEVFEGENLAGALWANSVFTLRRDDHTGTPRGLYCGIGHCYECRVAINGIAGIRACLVRAREGMQISLGSDTIGGGNE